MEGIHYDGDSLTYDIYDKQKEVLQDFISGNYDIVEFRAGNRAGKTVIGARALIYSAHMYEGTEYIAIANTNEQGRKSTWKAIFQNLPECDKDKPSDSPLIESYNKTAKKLKFNNGSVIWFSTAGSGDDAFVGSQFNGVWVDESDYMKNIYEIFDEGLKRQNSKPTYGIISTSTPDPNQNKHNSNYYSIVEKQEHPHTDTKLNYNIKTVTASLMDNPFVDEDIKQEYKRRHQHNAGTVLHGGFSSGNNDVVYDRFNKNEHVVDEDDLEELKFRNIDLYGYDAGYRHARVVLHVKVTVNNQFIVMNEFYEHESTVQDAISWLKDKPKGMLYSEHSLGDMKEFRRKLDGFSIQKADKDIDSGIDSVRSRLVEDTNGMVGLKVLESCNNTIDEFRTYANIGSQDGGDDAMDSLRYIIHTNTGRYIQSEDGVDSSKSIGFSRNNKPFNNRSRGSGKHL